MRVLLIRHAQTTSNTLGLLDSGVPGPELTPLGHDQARAIPAALAGRAVSGITVSNMTRTSQTAEPLALDRGLTPVVDAGLREIAAGEMEMQSSLEAVKRYVGVAWAWSAGDLAPRMPGAQNGFEFFERFDAAVDKALAEGGDAPVIVSHGASIRVWVGNRCRNVPEAFAAEAELHNTGSAVLERDARGAWDLLEWNPLPLGGPALHGTSGPGEEDPTGSLTADEVH